MSNVSHPKYYNTGKIEVIEFIEDKNLGFHLGNAVKYISRAGKKDPSKHQEDLEKAKWYLEREIEIKFAYDVRRPNDMREEKETVISMGKNNSTERYKIECILFQIKELFDQASFEDWEKFGDLIGGSIEEHPRMFSYKEWEAKEEDREELKELCSDYCIYFDTQYTGKDPDTMPIEEMKAHLRPLIQDSFDKGHEIGLLEKEIIDAPKVKKTKKEIKNSCNGDLLT